MPKKRGISAQNLQLQQFIWFGWKEIKELCRIKLKMSKLLEIRDFFPFVLGV